MRKPGYNAPSLSARVVIYFAINPDEALTTNDVIAKFNDEKLPASVHRSLEQWAKSGWLLKTTTGRGRGHHALYSAGPALRQMIGVQP